MGGPSTLIQIAIDLQMGGRLQIDSSQQMSSISMRKGKASDHHRDRRMRKSQIHKRQRLKGLRYEQRKELDFLQSVLRARRDVLKCYLNCQMGKGCAGPS